MLEVYWDGVLIRKIGQNYGKTHCVAFAKYLIAAPDFKIFSKDYGLAEVI